MLPLLEYCLEIYEMISIVTSPIEIFDYFDLHYFTEDTCPTPCVSVGQTLLFY